jgi:hypothetical protein
VNNTLLRRLIDGSGRIPVQIAGKLTVTGGYRNLNLLD